LDILLRIAKSIDRWNARIGKLTAWLCLVMIGVGTWNVVGRYLGRAVGQNLSSNALIEIQWYLFDLVFLLGAAYTLQQDEFVRVDPLYTRLKPKQQALANLVGTVLFLLPFCCMITFYSWGTIASSWSIQEMSPDPNGLPRYPIKAMILVSFSLLFLQGIAEAIKNFAVVIDRRSPRGANPQGTANPERESLAYSGSGHLTSQGKEQGNWQEVSQQEVQREEQRNWQEDSQGKEQGNWHGEEHHGN
jgi:TRAP-type mannitol/chloroaromatic compound transport system permease small subunit